MFDVRIYDTTLRDGAQREGISLSVGEQVRLAHLIDRMGFAFIEAGFPESNPKDAELFRALEADPPPRAQIAAFGMTRRRGARADEDVALRVLAESFAPVATIVGKTWDLHIDKVLRVDRDENLRMIEESIAFLRAEGKRVFYDAEHFFDGYGTDPVYALRCLRTAVEAGAESVILCDTNGATLPGGIESATRAIVAELGSQAEIGIHTHDDAGCAVANSIVAVNAGARQVQGTLNGYGERCGNANLVSIVPNLQLKLGLSCVDDDDLRLLTRLAHDAAEIVNLPPDTHAPYVGRFAFAHKGGMHVAGVSLDPASFEHLPPTLVGNRSHVLVSELSGRATIREVAEEHGLELGEDEIARALARLKDLEHRGYAFEAADASFELLLRAEAGAIEPLLTLESFRVVVEKQGGGTRLDRGSRQAARPRRAGRDRRRGERPRPRARPRPATRARGSLSRARERRAVELHRADPRSRLGHGRGHPRHHRVARRPRLVVDRRRLGEPHRGLVGSARRGAAVRRSRTCRRLVDGGLA